MAWLNGALLGGFALVAIPIVIHFAMRKKPKRIVFPALRFVQARSETNRRQLRIRRWLLLALRCLAIAALVTLLARPSVAAPLAGDWALVITFGGMALLGSFLLLAALAARRGPLLWVPLAFAVLALTGTTTWLMASVLTYGSEFPVGDARAPVSAAIVLDNSARSSYIQANQTVLGRAKAAAKRLVRALPADSQVAVLSLERETVFWSAGKQAAVRAIDRASALERPASLLNTLLQAERLVREGRHPRKEIYVFTDLTRPSWPDEKHPITQQLQKNASTSMYVIDVGVPEPENGRLIDLGLSAEAIAGAGTIELHVTFASSRPSTRMLELYLEKPDPSLPFVQDGRRVQPPRTLKDQAELTASPDQPARHTFYLGNLPPGTHHGELRFVETDPLAIDDIRYFTIVVRRPWKMLVAAGPQTSVPAWVEAVAPRELRSRGEAAFEVDVVPPTELTNADLTRADVVCLLDPPPLADDTWRRLHDWVEGGKGLCIALGPNAGESESFASKAAQEVLGCVPTIPFRARDAFLSPTSYEHPVLRPFRPFADSVPWNEFLVRRHWSVEQVDESCSVVMRYSNGEAALLEHPVGSGRVLIMTTPLTEIDRPQGRPSWNDLAGPNDWPRFILVNEMATYAAGAHAARYNYNTGETVILPNRAGESPASYQLARPQGPLQLLRASNGRLRIPWTDHAGHYRLKGVDDPTILRGFSANLADAQSDLSRVSEKELDALLGKDRYQLARTLDELERQQGTQRSGREFYPYLAILLAVLLIAEQAMANRFYGASAQEDTAGAARRSETPAASTVATPA